MIRITRLKYVPLFSICGPNVASRQNLQNSEKKRRKQSQPFKKRCSFTFSLSVFQSQWSRWNPVFEHQGGQTAADQPEPLKLTCSINIRFIYKQTALQTAKFTQKN